MTIRTHVPATSPDSSVPAPGPSLPGGLRVPPLLVAPLAPEDEAGADLELRVRTAAVAGTHRALAAAWSAIGGHAQAVAHLEAAATFGTTAAADLVLLGRARFLAGDEDGAVRTLLQVLAADARHGDAWYDLGLVLLGQGQLAEAAASLQRACELLPGDHGAWNDLGVCLWQMSRVRDARHCFQRALQLVPDDAAATSNLQHTR